MTFINHIVYIIQYMKCVNIFLTNKQQEKATHSKDWSRETESSGAESGLVTMKDRL